MEGSVKSIVLGLLLATWIFATVALAVSLTMRALKYVLIGFYVNMIYLVMKLNSSWVKRNLLPKLQNHIKKVEKELSH